MNSKSNKFSPEVRDRAVPFGAGLPLQLFIVMAVSESIASKIASSVTTLNSWVQRVEIDAGQQS